MKESSTSNLDALKLDACFSQVPRLPRNIGLVVDAIERLAKLCERLFKPLKLDIKICRLKTRFPAIDVALALVIEIQIQSGRCRAYTG